jgi:hypothetical protein
MKPGIETARPGLFRGLAGTFGWPWLHRAQLGATSLRQQFRSPGPWAPPIFPALHPRPGLLEARRFSQPRHGAEVPSPYRAVNTVA